MKRVDTVFNELDRLHQATRERAYDLFQDGGTMGQRLERLVDGRA